MTNEEKAQEIKSKDPCQVWIGGCPNVYVAAMEMAKWKDDTVKAVILDYYEKCDALNERAVIEIAGLLCIELPDDKHKLTVAEAYAKIKAALPNFALRFPIEDYKAVEVRQDIDGTHYKFIIGDKNYQTATVGGIGGDRYSD